ncbi:MBL fold metallo-hydrolase [Pseudaminobacter sp. 19-2017]|uniref:MBL fold metallo-hydrolase n=1 Tax=Pseudaminobacter soli (ex Zhang et al. 2022) TaxID=2831468 RepID=A0A942IBZ6_9HYPH|nr:MBL fold metallo-hydrolase [Pseudaminobacter soli]MBS3652131.1 MBL fold metallo-hydrolase [Pseudaminobacter soli]
MSEDATGDWFVVADLGGGLFRIHEPHVHRFFRGNVFLLRGRDANLLIDFGMGLRPLAPLVAGLAGRAPLIAVATHSHADHIGGLHEFADRRAHSSEAVACASMPDSATFAPMFRALDEPVTVPPGPGWQKQYWRIAPAPLTATLDEGQIIDLGDRRFEVLHLPGHSPGSIGLLDRENGLFFAGDAIYRGTLVDDLPHSDRVVYRKTMARIASLDVAIAHGGHGEALSAQEMREIALGYLAGA